MRRKKVRVFMSESFDPWFNLATEDWLFRDMGLDTQTLFLWRNQETVVIGRFQNPWTECHLKRMEADGVLLARRQSGGGAVFHDLGNTNFTFLSGREEYERSANTQIIVRALKKFGVKAYPSGRNDIMVDDPKDGQSKKISGSAFKETKDRAFHHGTLLISTNLNRLADYLNPQKKKLQSKGVTSVRSRVANLSEVNPRITHENICEAIVDEFFSHYQSQCDIERLDEEFLRKIPSLQSEYEQLKEWNWRFGKTPEFVHHLEERFEWGAIDIHLNASKGAIEEVQIFSDCLYPEMIEKLMEQLQGKRYTGEGLAEAINLLMKEFPHYDHILDELRDWIVNQVH